MNIYINALPASNGSMVEHQHTSPEKHQNLGLV